MLETRSLLWPRALLASGLVIACAKEGPGDAHRFPALDRGAATSAQAAAGGAASAEAAGASGTAPSGHRPSTAGAGGEGAGAEAKDGAPLRVYTAESYPCTDCHEPGDVSDINTERRALDDPHTELALDHGPKEASWCYQCHSKEDRDALMKAGGTEVAFVESHLLCAQCHGEELRDWQAGVHGKRLGLWNGPKEELACVDCHSAHTPRFPSLRPLPPPKAPSPSHP